MIMKVWYLGRPGKGRAAEVDDLGLHGKKYCLGGQGVIFSHESLVRLSSGGHLDACRQESATSHEDTGKVKRSCSHIVYLSNMTDLCTYLDSIIICTDINSNAHTFE